MSLLSRILAWLGLGRSAASQAPAAQPDAAALEGQGQRPLLAAAGFGDPDAWAAALARPMRVRGIHGPRRVAAFLATIAHESNGGRALEENKRYSAKRLMEVWPKRFPTLAAARDFAWDPTDPDLEDVALANAVYGRRLGNERNGTADNDGWTYRGRGLIQLTGLTNYSMAADALGLPLVTAPDLVATKEGAAETAAWWWAAHGCNELADAGEVEPWRRRVNGGLIGLADVRRRYHDVLAAMGAEVLSA